MTLKKLKIIDTFIVFALCFLFHFLYSWFPNKLFSIFFPVNESIWEHMKLIYTSFLMCSLTDFIFSKIFNLKINNLIFSNFYSSIICIMVYLIIYIPINHFLGHNTLVAITLLFLIIILGQIISYNLMIKENNIKLNYISVALIIIGYIIFGLLTYYPPKTELFFDEQNNKYGINDYVI